MLFGNKKILIHKLSVPIPSAKSAEINIKTGTGNLVVGRLGDGDQLLVSGDLQYLEKQEVPTQDLSVKNDHATLVITAVGGRQPGFRLPWRACNGATEWSLRFNPKIPLDISTYSGGGNIKLNLAGMNINSVLADTGGGNVELILPDKADNLTVTSKTGGGNITVRLGSGLEGKNSIIAKSGAGNVSVQVPGGIAGKIHAKSGWGKVVIDPRFNKIVDGTYQTPGYDSASNKVEISIESGAGNVSVANN